MKYRLFLHQWEVADAAAGPWTDMAGEVFKDLTLLAGNTTKYNRRQAFSNDALCTKRLLSTSSVATVTVATNTSPIANANGPQWFVCGTTNSVALTGSASGGSDVYTNCRWYAGSYLVNPVATTANYTPTNVASATTYILKVTDNATNCRTTATVVVTVAADCLGADCGDAPTVYDGTNPASHGIIRTLRIGNTEDAEGYAVNSSLADGDDNNQVSNDEEGVSFLPYLNTTTKSIGVLVNNVLNNTGNTAYLVGWADFNKDGDFNDPGERSQIVAISSYGLKPAHQLQPASSVVQRLAFSTTIPIRLRLCGQGTV